MMSKISIRKEKVLALIYVCLIILISSCTHTGTFTKAQVDTHTTPFIKEPINMKVALVVNKDIKEKVLSLPSIGSIKLKLYPTLINEIQSELSKIFFKVIQSDENTLSSEKYDAYIYIDAGFEITKEQKIQWSAGGRMLVIFDVRDGSGTPITRVSELVDMENKLVRGASAFMTGFTLGLGLPIEAQLQIKAMEEALTKSLYLGSQKLYRDQALLYYASHMKAGNQVKVAEEVTNKFTSGGVIFTDTFIDNRNKWYLGTVEAGRCSIEGGNYIIEAIKPFQAYKDINLSEGSDFEIEVDYSKAEGLNEKSYGILWGFKTEGNIASQNGSLFAINGQGQFYVGQLIAGKHSLLIPLTPSTYIKKPQGNTLKIVNKGVKTSFYINNKYVGQISSQPFYGRKIAFYASDGLTISIKRVLVSLLHEEYPNSTIVKKQVEPYITKPVLADEIEEDIRDIPNFMATKRDNDFAVIIGIENYQSVAKSEYSLSDAGLVKDYFKALGFQERNIEFIINERATKSGIEKSIEGWLPNRIKKGSSVIVYYSGHGAPDPESGNSYIVPYDGDPNYLSMTGYPLQKMYDRLGKSGAKEIIIVLDSCFSGGGGRSILAKGARPLVMTTEVPHILSNMVVLTATQGSQISTSSSEKGHGVLTYYFLKAIKDGKRNIAEIYEFIKPQVENEAKQLNVQQSPSISPDIQKLEGRFSLRN